MKNIKSLRAGIFSEIVIVILPLVALVVYQSVSDITTSGRLAEAYRLHAASLLARQEYRLFLNGVVDAVDTGRVTEDAVKHLDGSAKALRSVGSAKPVGTFDALALKAQALGEKVRRDRTLSGLLPLRESINALDREMAALDARCDGASRGMIQGIIDSARSRKKVVFATLLPGGLLTVCLIFLLLRHIGHFEKALRASEQRMRVMFESINAGIVLVDRGKRAIVDVNLAALRMYGGAKEELIGTSCFRLFHSATDTVCPVVDQGKSLDISKRILNRHDGSELPILKSVTEVTIDGHGYLLESFVDLSEQVALEEKLKGAKEAAEAANRAKSIFLASMSHEIRTPMNAILGYAQLLRREQDLTSKQENHLDIINRSGEHLLKVINDILEMSKIEAGAINVTLHPFGFHQLLSDIRSLFAARAGQKGVEFVVELEGEVPAVLNADEGKVRQVLINLIGNSVKFTDRGEISVRVVAASLPPSPDGDAEPSVLITVDVQDTGSGINLDEADKVFASFEQTESGRHKIGGTGLGMPISREFARFMGGDLVLLSSETGKGSVFRFTFKAQVLEAESLQPGPSERCVRHIAPNEKQWRVLVVDDQETNRSLLSQVLTQAGFAVDEAADGSIGVERFDSGQPDIVLMDILMPEMDGYEAMRRIKGTPLGAKTPIVAITASVMMDERQKALEQGFDGFIMKPVPMNDLFEEIRRLTNVAYLYEESRPPAGAAPQLAALTAADLASLSRSLLIAMREALDAGDMVTLRVLIGELGSGEQALASSLRRLVDTYAYDTLNALLAGGTQRC